MSEDRRELPELYLDTRQLGDGEVVVLALNQQWSDSALASVERIFFDVLATLGTQAPVTMGLAHGPGTEVAGLDRSAGWQPVPLSANDSRSSFLAVIRDPARAILGSWMQQMRASMRKVLVAHIGFDRVPDLASWSSQVREWNRNWRRSTSEIGAAIQRGGLDYVGTLLEVCRYGDGGDYTMEVVMRREQSAALIATLGTSSRDVGPGGSKSSGP